MHEYKQAGILMGIGALVGGLATAILAWRLKPSRKYELKEV